MPVSTPLVMRVPRGGACFAHSVHGADFHMRERADPFHKIIYVLHGCVRREGEDLPPGRDLASSRARELERGAVWLVPSGWRHRLSDVSPATLLLLGIDAELLANDTELGRLWTGLAPKGGRVLMLARPTRLQLDEVWRRALLENLRERPGRGCALRAAATQLVVLLARQAQAPVGESARSRVEAVARELAESFYEEWDLDRGSARAGLSRRRFSALFRDATGCSFAERLTELRIAHAAQLLAGGERSVVGVMFACGFKDLSHFYRLFRARHGVPPKAWRDGRRVGD